MRVSALPGAPRSGRLQAGTAIVSCTLGTGGIGRLKREGDGRTPAGIHGLQTVLFRRDRGPRPVCGLAARAIEPDDGWCDDPASACYNRPVRLPFAPSHERLWRDDRLYDLVVVIAFNTGPVQRRRGSAIFMHLEAPDRRPTAGCVALGPAALRRLLARIGPRTRLLVA